MLCLVPRRFPPLQPENTVFHGEANIRDYTPPNSRVPRRFCKKCGTYIAEDARPVLGVYALPLGLCSEVDKIYWPKQHIFYVRSQAASQPAYAQYARN